MLNVNQAAALATALRAETDQSVIDALAIGNAIYLASWCNGASAVDAWNEAMTAKALFETMTVAKYDNLTAGKRDAYRVLMDFAPQDMSRQKLRNGMVDIWGATDSVSMLQDCRRKATRAEVYITPNIVGNQATTNTVVGLKLNWTGTLSHTEISMALNANPA